MQQLMDFISKGNIIDAFTIINSEFNFRDQPPIKFGELEAYWQKAKQAKNKAEAENAYNGFISTWNWFSSKGLSKKSGLDVLTTYPETEEGKNFCKLLCK